MADTGSFCVDDGRIVLGLPLVAGDDVVVVVVVGDVAIWRDCCWAFELAGSGSVWPLLCSSSLGRSSSPGLVRLAWRGLV